MTPVLKHFWMVALLLLLSGCGGGRLLSDGSARTEQLSEPLPAPLIIAHRGYSGIAPENTRVAVELGIESGAEFIEIDVQMSADGGLVVMHDTTLVRTTNAPLLYPLRAPWNVADFSLAEMQALDAGTWYGYAKEPGNFSYVGEPVPDLRTILDTLAGRSGLLLEVKSPELYPGIEAAIARELEDAGWVVDGRAVERLAVQSFDWASMARYAALHPHVPTELLGQPPQDEAGWQAVIAYADAINPSHSGVDESTVDAVHQRGLNISVYTVNDAPRMAELMAMGVDGIITDQPVRALLVRDGAEAARGEFQLSNEAVTELSGVAPSQAVPGMYWGLNDSGDQARVFAFDGRGRDLGEMAVQPAVNVDWEDMASFRAADGDYLLMADVGDNEAVRPFVSLYLAPEPGQPPVSGVLNVQSQIHLQYPDGPRDCEGVAVDAAEGFIYLLSKRDPLPRLYRLPLQMAGSLLPVTAEFVGEISSLPLPQSGQLEPAGSITNVSPTALAFSADGQYALIVTLEHSYRYRREAGQSWLDALNSPPEILDMPDYPQIEAGDFLGSGPGLLIGSEGQPAALFAAP